MADKKLYGVAVYRSSHRHLGEVSHSLRLLQRRYPDSRIYPVVVEDGKPGIPRGAKPLAVA